MPLVEEFGAATGPPELFDKDTDGALTAENRSAGQRPEERAQEERVQEETVPYVFAGAAIGSAVSIGGSVHHGCSKDRTGTCSPCTCCPRSKSGGGGTPHPGW